MESKIPKEDVKELGELTFVNLAKDLLDSSVESSEIMKQEPYTETSAKKAKLTLGFLNAFLKAYTTRMNYWKFTGVKDAVKALEGVDKKRYK